MDEITLKLQMATQREMLRAMGAETARDAAITRAEAAEAALAECREELQASDTLLDLEQWQAGWQARAESAEAALASCRHDLAEMIERKEYFRQIWEVAEAALAVRDTPCVWREGVDGWMWPGCDEGFIRQTGLFQFCPYCGHPIEFGPTPESAR